MSHYNTPFFVVVDVDDSDGGGSGGDGGGDFNRSESDVIWQHGE